MMKKLLVLPILTVLSPALADATPIIQSSLDSKEYRALTLDNGLKVVLVSDPAADKAAASLDVKVGNGSDPENWQGLAHFLEHMLFLGTEKYPEAGEYKKFIDDHGGGNNAFTSFSHTNYFFDISAEHLRPALDRFSRFFIDPTFDETFVERERAVVHSEYQSRLKDEFRRAWSARRSLLNPAHPASRFAVGSEETLRDRAGDDNDDDDDGGMTARQKLIEFYQRHYSADIMTLAVVGFEPLDQLQRWVTEMFAEVANRNATAQSFTQPYLTRRAERLNTTPQKDELRVSFFFPIDSVEALYRGKPLGYLANLIGHEGEGSLLALLEELGWAQELSAGPGYMDEVQGTFEVSIQLTEPGLARIEDIGELLFQYIALIKATGVEAWRYDEQRALADIAFRFAEEPAAAANARRLASGLHRYPLADLLRGPYMMEEYRPDWIADILARLRPDNVLMQVVAKGLETDDKTPFYGVDFGITPIPPATLARWQKGAQNPRLALPAANRFIPERLSPLDLPPTSAVPQRLDEDPDGRPGTDTWYHGDAQFGTPRAVFYFSVKSPLAGAGAQELALSELLVRMVNRQLDTATYPARLANLRHELYRHSRGFSVRLSGYEDKQPALLKTVLQTLLAPRFDAAQLALVKNELRREWKNTALESPSQQTVHELYRLLLHPYWSEAERLGVLDALTVEDVREHAARLVENIHITALSHGDVTRARAAQMRAMLESAFAESKWLSEVPRSRVRRLADGESYLRTLDVDHDDSALAVYFQGFGKSIEESAKMFLLASLVEPPFFFNLRTTNRVGYLVHATPLNILETPGLLFSVQSSTHTPARIHQLITEFLDEFEVTLSKMDAAQFAQVKQGLTDRILTRDKKLGDRAARYWREIDRREFTFDTRRRITEAIASLSQSDMLAYFRRLSKTEARQLLVQSPGRRPQAAGGAIAGEITGEPYTAIGDTAQFRETVREFFPAYR